MMNNGLALQVCHIYKHAGQLENVHYACNVGRKGRAVFLHSTHLFDSVNFVCKISH